MGGAAVRRGGAVRGVAGSVVAQAAVVDSVMSLVYVSATSQRSRAPIVARDRFALLADYLREDWTSLALRRAAAPLDRLALLFATTLRQVIIKLVSASAHWLRKGASELATWKIVTNDWNTIKGKDN